MTLGFRVRVWGLGFRLRDVEFEAYRLGGGCDVTVTVIYAGFYTKHVATWARGFDCQFSLAAQ